MGYSHLAPNTSAATAAVQSAHQGVAQSYQNIGKAISEGINNTIEQHRKGEEHSQAMTHRDAEHGQKIRHNEQQNEADLKVKEAQATYTNAQAGHTSTATQQIQSDPKFIMNNAIANYFNNTKEGRAKKASYARDITQNGSFQTTLYNNQPPTNAYDGMTYASSPIMPMR